MTNKIKQKVTFNVTSEGQNSRPGYKIYQIFDFSTNNYSFLKIPADMNIYKGETGDNRYVIDLPTPSSAATYTETLNDGRGNKGLNFDQKNARPNIRSLFEEIKKYKNIRAVADINDEVKFFLASCNGSPLDVNGDIIKLECKTIKLLSDEIYKIINDNKKSLLELGLKFNRIKLDDDLIDKEDKSIDNKIKAIDKIKSNLLEIIASVESDKKRVAAKEWKNITEQVEEIISGKQDDYLKTSEITNLMIKIRSFFPRYSFLYLTGTMPGEKAEAEAIEKLKIKSEELTKKLKGDKKDIKADLQEREQRGEDIKDIRNMLNEVKGLGETETIKDALKKRDERNQQYKEELAEQVAQEEIDDVVSEVGTLVSDFDSATLVGDEEKDKTYADLHKRLAEVQKKIDENIGIAGGKGNKTSNAALYKEKEELRKKIVLLNEDNKDNNKAKKSIANTVQKVAESTRKFVDACKKIGKGSSNNKQKNINQAKNLRSKISNFLGMKNISSQDSKNLKSLASELDQIIMSQEKNTPTTSTNGFPWQVVAPISLVGLAALVAFIIIRKRNSRRK